MKIKTTKLYGILDDFGLVVKWQDYKPVDREFVIKIIPVKPRASLYDIAMAKCGEALI